MHDPRRRAVRPGQRHLADLRRRPAGRHRLRRAGRGHRPRRGARGMRPRRCSSPLAGAALLAGCSHRLRRGRRQQRRRVPLRRRHAGRRGDPGRTSAAPRRSSPGTLLDGGGRSPRPSCAGNVAVLNFWGSWCAPCRVETPEFQRGLRRGRTTAASQFLGLNVKETSEQFAAAFVDRFGITFPSLYDPRGEVALAFRDYPGERDPVHHRAGPRSGRVAAVYTGAVPPGRPAQRPRPGPRGGVTWGDLQPLVTDGPLLVAARRRGAGRADQLRLALRAAAGARLPRLRLRPGRHRRPGGCRAGRRPAGSATAVRTDERSPRGRMVAGALLFVLGFTVGLRRLRDGVRRPGPAAARSTPTCSTGCFGVVTIVVGLGLPRLAAAAAAHRRGCPPGPAAGLAGAPLLGIVFGLGWTPCLGPTLSAVYSLAFTEATATPRRAARRRLLPGPGRPVRARRARRPLGHGGDLASCAGTPAR